MYNVNAHKEKLQKNADANIEDSVRYRAEKMGKLFQLANFWKNLQAKAVVGKVFLQWKHFSNEDINYINIIAVKISIMPFILITPESPKLS